MKFYILKLKLWSNEVMDESSKGPKVYPNASGIAIENSNDFLGIDGKIHSFICAENAPVFDYFSLISISYKGEYDWILLDAYAFGGQNTPSIRGFLISQRLKVILESYRIAKPYKFYPAKLMYQGEKLNYFIFQLAQNEWEEFSFQDSKYYNLKANGELERIVTEVNSSNEFKKLLTEAKKDKRDMHMSLVLNKFSDIFFFSQIGFVVSENLKNEMLSHRLKDFEFLPIENIDFNFKDNIG